MRNIEEIPAYVICLEKKRKDRCDKNFSSIQQLFPKAERTQAVDGSTITLDDKRISIYTKHHIQTGIDTDMLHLGSIGAVGCSMSHINLWEKIVQTKKPSIVVEDDMYISEKKRALLSEAFQRIPDGTDYASLLYLPWPLSQLKSSSYDDHFKKIDSRDTLTGTQMYYITPRGATILLQYALPIVTHVDAYIAYVASTLDHFSAVYYKKQIYTLDAFMKDNIGSTIRHSPQIKKMLPDGNAFYICTIVFIFILVALFLWLVKRQTSLTKPH